LSVRMCARSWGSRSGGSLTDGWVHIYIIKGMYGLKQLVLIANQLLQNRLADLGYYPARHTPGLWLHKRRPIAFSLIVDNFAVKYVVKKHADNLINVMLVMS
jgi:hypothetical protein